MVLLGRASRPWTKGPYLYYIFSNEQVPTVHSTATGNRRAADRNRVVCRHRRHDGHAAAAGHWNDLGRALPGRRRRRRCRRRPRNGRGGGGGGIHQAKSDIEQGG